MKYLYIIPCVILAYLVSPLALLGIRLGWKPKDADGWPIERIHGRPFMYGARSIIHGLIRKLTPPKRGKE